MAFPGIHPRLLVARLAAKHIPTPGSGEPKIVSYTDVMTLAEQFRTVASELEPDWQQQWRRGWFASDPDVEPYLVITTRGSALLIGKVMLGDEIGPTTPFNIRRFLQTRYLDPHGLSWPSP